MTTMLSIDRAKQLLNDPTLSDKETEEIRDECHALAEIIFDKWWEEREQKKIESKKETNNEYQNEHHSIPSQK